MTRNQLAILWIGVALTVAMAVCPPWEYRPVLRYAMTAPAGYHLIFAPPKMDNVRVDLRRLGIQWTALLVVVGAAMLTQARSSGKE